MWRAPLDTGAKVALPEAAQACVKPAALPPHKQSYTREPTGQQDLWGGREAGTKLRVRNISVHLSLG